MSPHLSVMDYWERLAQSLKKEYPGLSDTASPWLPKPFVKRAMDWEENGKDLIVQMQVSEGLLLGRGEYALDLSASFRGCPPGREGQRHLPWFILAASHGLIIGAKSGDEDEVVRISAYFRGRPLSPTKVEGLPYTLFIDASYPKARAGLQSARWLSRFKYWDSMSCQGKLDSGPPLFSGLVPQARLQFFINKNKDPEDYVVLIKDFSQAVDDVERLFDSPLLSEVSRQTRVEVVKRKVGSESRKDVVVTCRKCGNVEDALLFGNPPYNVGSEKCRALMFLNPPAKGGPSLT